MAAGELIIHCVRCGAYSWRATRQLGKWCHATKYLRAQKARIARWRHPDSQCKATLCGVEVTATMMIELQRRTRVEAAPDLNRRLRTKTSPTEPLLVAMDVERASGAACALLGLVDEDLDGGLIQRLWERRRGNDGGGVEEDADL